MAAKDAQALFPAAPGRADLAFLFAGQGAQHPGMGRELAESSAAARQVFSLADQACPGTSQMCFSGDAQELARTENTQPCVFACDLACAAALVKRGAVPGCVAGFSLGELAALTFAGAFDVAGGFSAVLERASLMQEACDAAPGSMAAVLKLDPKRVEELAAQAGECWPVNYNSPQQTVVAGTARGLETLGELVRQAGGRAKPLAVGGAFHSPLMEPATRRLPQALARADMGAPRLPVWANATAAPYPASGEEARELLARQASSPVRWTDALRGMWDAGVRAFVEVGPGHVLTGLVRRTLPDAAALSVEYPDQLGQALAQLGLASRGDARPED